MIIAALVLCAVAYFGWRWPLVIIPLLLVAAFMTRRHYDLAQTRKKKDEDAV